MAISRAKVPSGSALVYELVVRRQRPPAVAFCLGPGADRETGMLGMSRLHYIVQAKYILWVFVKDMIYARDSWKSLQLLKIISENEFFQGQWSACSAGRRGLVAAAD